MGPTANHEPFPPTISSSSWPEHSSCYLDGWALIRVPLSAHPTCGAISVHGYCGTLGGLCVGIFADGHYGAGWNGVGVTDYLGKAGQGVTGLLYGDFSQFKCQLLGAGLNIVWAFGATFIVFKVVN